MPNYRVFASSHQEAGVSFDEEILFHISLGDLIDEFTSLKDTVSWYELSKSSREALIDSASEALRDFVNGRIFDHWDVLEHAINNVYFSLPEAADSDDGVERMPPPML